MGVNVMSVRARRAIHVPLPQADFHDKFGTKLALAITLKNEQVWAPLLARQLALIDREGNFKRAALARCTAQQDDVSSKESSQAPRQR